MKRFFCAAFFVVVVALLAACGALNTSVCLVNKLSRKMRCGGKLTGDQWSPLHTQ